MPVSFHAKGFVTVNRAAVEYWNLKDQSPLPAEKTFDRSALFSFVGRSADSACSAITAAYHLSGSDYLYIGTEKGDLHVLSAQF